MFEKAKPHFFLSFSTIFRYWSLKVRAKKLVCNLEYMNFRSFYTFISKIFKTLINKQTKSVLAYVESILISFHVWPLNKAKIARLSSYASKTQKSGLYSIMALGK